MTGVHVPVLYRTKEQSRHEVPAEICGGCSDVTAGRLVPASFCRMAAEVMKQEGYA